MDKTDFVEVAKFCHDEVEEKCRKASKKWFVKTLYAAIGENEEIIVSSTSHILRDATRCILIHEWHYLAVTLTYDAYTLQYIDEAGSVNEGNLGEGYAIGIHPASFNCPAKMYLRKNNVEIFRTRTDFSGNDAYSYGWEAVLKDVWKLYLKCQKECTTEKEVRLLCDLVKQQNDISLLQNKIDVNEYYKMLVQKERDAYKQVLDEIKGMVINR